jgi:hypothetical protein
MRVLVVVEGKHEHEGAVGTLIQRLRPDLADLEFERLANSDIHVHPGKGRGYEKKAIRWMREAHKRGYEAVVLLVDRDKVAERTTEVTSAQNHTAACTIRRALGVAIESFDAWMLADEKAVSKVLAKTVQTQRDPEAIANPKERFTEALAGLGLEWGGAALYARIAATLDISRLEARCPQGFAVFADRLRNI